MITAYKIIPTAALLMAAALQTAPAQTTNIDAALVLNFNLNAVSQGPTTTTTAGVSASVQVTKITSRDIIDVLGAATGNTFSKKARLVVLTPTNDLEDWAAVQVQDGTTAVDVTGFVVHNPGVESVESGFAHRRTGATGGTEYSIDSFGLQDVEGFPTLSKHFSLSGFTATASRDVVTRGQITGQQNSVDADVSGTGDSNASCLSSKARWMPMASAPRRLSRVRSLSPFPESDQSPGPPALKRE